MVRSVKIGRDDYVGEPLLPGNREVGMVKEYEGHADDLTNDNHAGVGPDCHDAKAFDNNFHKFIENMEAKASCDMVAFVAVMNFMKAPDIF